MGRRINESVIKKIVKRQLELSYNAAEKDVVSALTNAILDNSEQAVTKSIVQVLNSKYPGSDLISLTSRRIFAEVYTD
jgi:hypothetical protein